MASILRYCNLVDPIGINAEASLTATILAEHKNEVLKNGVSSSGLIQIYRGGEDRKKNRKGDSGPFKA